MSVLLGFLYDDLKGQFHLAAEPEVTGKLSKSCFGGPMR